MTDTPSNSLSLPGVLALSDEQLAELVAVRYFRWEVANRAPLIFKHRVGERSVAYTTRPFHPTRRADDDHLALRWVRTRARPLLGRMGLAMLDIARARLKSEVDPCCVSVYASRGDYCRALLLATSSSWRAEPGARARASTGGDAEWPDTQPKEPRHEHLDEPTNVLRTTAAAPTSAASASESVGAGAATPAPLPAVHSHRE